MPTRIVIRILMKIGGISLFTFPVGGCFSLQGTHPYTRIHVCLNDVGHVVGGVARISSIIVKLQQKKAQVVVHRPTV